MSRTHAGWVAMLMVMAIAPACGRSTSPATLDPTIDQCRFCRMIVSDARSASQIVSPYEEPLFFDDLGCLGKYLSETNLPSGAVVYVADHGTTAWVRADEAVFTRLETSAAAMGSHIIAHASESARAADAQAARGVPVDRAVVVPARAGSGRAQ